MRIITGEATGREFVGVLSRDGEAIINLGLEESMLQCIEKGEEFVSFVEKVLADVEEGTFPRSSIYKKESVKMQAPIPRPRKNIVCVGKNYRDHAIEMGSAADIPEDIIFFTKAPTTVIGVGEDINSYPHLTKGLDYEGELAIIIGKKGQGISVDEAMDYVFGYTIMNDVTARDVQKRHKQFFLGKSFDTFSPMGPVIVPKKCIENPMDLNIVTKVNGEVRQNGNTSDMIFDIPTIISVLSQGMTLEPGDIIATGTPAGVGNGFNPPKYLQAGDTVDITIEGIGTLYNTVK